MDDFLNKPIELYRKIYEDFCPLGQKSPAISHSVGNLEINNINKLKLYKYLDLKFSNEYIIYSISDIHADFKRFLDYLELNEFIKKENDEYFWNSKKKKIILVICGDFIDGFRGRDNLFLGEDNEISLLQFIYNLRLDAINYDSYIFCTFGNHDYFSIHPMLNSIEKHTYAYLDYIDTNSYIFYLENSPFKDDVSSEKDLIFLTRAYYLSRFYLTGYHFFLKINDTLFAHAGFHKNREIFDKFSANSNSNSNLSPMLFHRKILEKLSNLQNYLDYFKTNNLKNITYKNFYNSIVNSIIQKYETNNIFNTRNINIEINRLKNSSNNSILDNFFLTRRIRNNCDELEEILNIYNCNLLVVGHCPTCVCDFELSEINGVNSCNNAKIAFSCNKKLATIDIAFSSAFSPKKEFLESLCITNNNNKKQVYIHRISLDKFQQSFNKQSNIYNQLTYNSNNQKWE